MTSSACRFLTLLVVGVTACGNSPATAPDATTPGTSTPDAGLVPAERFHPGNFGRLQISRDKRFAVVRGIEAGDEWIRDEYNERYRPRLHLVGDTGGLMLLTPIAARRVWFAADGVFYIDLARDPNVLMYADRSGGMTEVLAGAQLEYLALTLNLPGTVAIAHKRYPAGHVVFDTEAARALDTGEFVPLMTDDSGACVVGTEANSLVVWNVGTDKKVSIAPLGNGAGASFGEVLSGRGVFLTGRCDLVIYRDADDLIAFDVKTEVARTLAQVSGRAPIALTPDQRQAYLLDDAGLRRASLAGGPEQLIRPAPIVQGWPTLPTHHHWLFLVDPDEPSSSDPCWRIMTVNLETGTLSVSSERMCPLFGHTGLSEDGRWALYTDGPLNSIVSPVDDLEGGAAYCPAFRCIAPGVVAPNGTRLLVAHQEDGGSGYSTMAMFDAADPSSGLVPLFQSDGEYDAYYQELIRFTTDASWATFGNETVTGWRCPAELRLVGLDAPAAAATSHPIASDVVDVEVTATDTLLYIVGTPRGQVDQEHCQQWTPSDTFELGLHVVPKQLWINAD